jgi:quercetin dioxygenase-like cupin family protein
MDENTSQRIEERPAGAGGHNIKRRLRAVVVCSALALFTLLLVGSFGAQTARATPSSGVSQTPIASGVLTDAIRLKWKQANDSGFGDGLDISNVAIVKNIVQPGGSFGWHQHGGPSWIVVTQGTLTFYDADDPRCAAYPVSAGHAFFDAGNHTHNARNLTDQVAENYVVRMLPSGATPRLDITPAPANCPF